MEYEIKDIVDCIFDELCDRKGFDGFWDYLDSDIQDELKMTVKNIISSKLK